MRSSTLIIGLASASAIASPIATKGPTGPGTPTTQIESRAQPTTHNTTIQTSLSSQHPPELNTAQISPRFTNTTTSTHHRPGYWIGLGAPCNENYYQGYKQKQCEWHTKTVLRCISGRWEVHEWCKNAKGGGECVEKGKEEEGGAACEGNDGGCVVM